MIEVIRCLNSPGSGLIYTICLAIVIFVVVLVKLPYRKVK